MKTFTIYDALTGKILRSGTTNTDDLSSMLQAGEALIEGVCGNRETQRIDTAAAPPAIVEADAPAPSLDSMKASGRVRLAERRWQVEVGGIEVGGSRIATDRESQAMMTGAVAYCGMDPQASIRWKTADGFVTIDGAALQVIAIAVGRHVQACFAREAELSELIDSATDATSLVGIASTITDFWPA